MCLDPGNGTGSRPAILNLNQPEQRGIIIDVPTERIRHRRQCRNMGRGGHDRTVEVKRAVARELCTPGL